MVLNAALDMLGAKPLINAHVCISNKKKQTQFLQLDTKFYTYKHKCTLKVVMSGFLDKTVENDVQLLRMASTVSSYATVAMTTVLLRLDVSVQCQVSVVYFLLY